MYRGGDGAEGKGPGGNVARNNTTTVGILIPRETLLPNVTQDLLSSWQDEFDVSFLEIDNRFTSIRHHLICLKALKMHVLNMRSTDFYFGEEFLRRGEKDKSIGRGITYTWLAQGSKTNKQ